MGQVLGEDEAQQEPALRPLPPECAHAAQGKGEYTLVLSFMFYSCFIVGGGGGPSFYVLTDACRSPSPYTDEEKEKKIV